MSAFQPALARLAAPCRTASPAATSPAPSRWSPATARSRSTGFGRPRSGRRRADAAGRDLPHLFDDQADRLRRRDDAVGGRPAAAERSDRANICRPSPTHGRRCPAAARMGTSRRRPPDHRAGPAAPHLRPDLRIPRRHADASGLRRGQGRPAAQTNDEQVATLARCPCSTSPGHAGNTAAPPTCWGGW